MVLQDLTVGQNVSVELTWENITYILNASTVGKNDTGILIVPVPDQDEVIQVIRYHVRHLNFTMYAIDELGNRVSWKNIKLYPMTYKDRIYFACGTNLFNANAESSERRNDQRVLLEAKGEIVYFDGKTEGIIHDVSNSGISFIVNSDVVFDNTKVYINFTDIINDNDFSISEAARIVRTCQNDQQTLYGCRLLNASKDYLTYMYLKRMYQKADKRKEKE